MAKLKWCCYISMHADSYFEKIIEGVSNDPMKANVAVAGFSRWSRSDAGGGFFAAFAGFLVCWYLFGLDILWIYNWGWMLRNGDYPSFFLGWDAFRGSPWHFPLWCYCFFPPIGLGPVYADAIPLLAVPAKLLSVVIPGRWQYFGLWLYLCFMLQGYWGYRLLTLISPSHWFRWGGVLLLLIAPPLVNRYGHLALCCHWLWPAMLWLYFRSAAMSWGRLAVYLLAVIAFAALVHPYVVIMALSLASAILLHRYSPGTPGGWKKLSAISAGLGATVLVCWYATGVFMLKPLPMRDGWGYYSMNLNALFNPMGYGKLLPDWPLVLGQYEGFNYLGAGGLLLVGCGLWLTVRNRRKLLHDYRRSLWPLVAALTVLTVLAVSCTVAWHRQILIDWRPVSEWMREATSLFRSSGRFFWPVYYALVLGTLYLLSARRRKSATFFLWIALFLQCLDLNYVTCRPLVIREAAFVNALKSPVWQELFRRYPRICWVGNAGNTLVRENDDYDFILAMDYRVNSINRFPFGRYDLTILRQQEAMEERLASGQLEADAVYCFGVRTTPEIIAGVKRAKAVFLRVDGYLAAVGNATGLSREALDCRVAL